MRLWIAIMVFAVGLCACSRPAPTPQANASASETDGPFRLELRLPHAEWNRTEPITGTVTLSFAGPKPTTISGSGQVLNFSYSEVGGTRQVDPVWTADCAIHTLGPKTPITVALGKTGAASDSDPSAAFQHAFLFDSPDVRLPAGTWDVTALAIFNEGEGCSAGSHDMQATVRITVGG
jgi:hypothetical protein